MALYGAKADGRGTYRFFEAAMDARMKRGASSRSRCAQALARGEFELHYQPLVERRRPAHHRLRGAAALAPSATRGMIPPAEFIPVAEEIGLIVPLGEWVLRKACVEAATWPDAHQGRGQPVADPVHATTNLVHGRGRARSPPRACRRSGSSSRSPNRC